MSIPWRASRCLFLLVYGAALGFGASAQGIPSLAELEAAGARIGEIRIDTRNIFDLDDPEENKWLFRLANRLHVRTSSNVIRRSLLFKSGEPLSVRAIEETERLLRATRYIYEVEIRPVAVHDGIVDLEVATRDTWTLDPSVNFSRSGGVNTSSVSLRDYNLLGTGMAVGFARTYDVDRSGTEFRISQDRAWRGGTSFSYTFADFDDGRRQSLSLAQPFYALDARRAGGISAVRDRRIDSIYRDGSVIAQYRRHEDKGEVFAGWSDGVVAGFTRRYSAGLAYLSDAYRLDPGLAAPAQLPADQKLAAPFVRYEILEDDYRKLKNRDLIERPEYFAMGFHLTAQLGRAMKGLGGDRNLWLYSAEVSDGFTIRPGDQLLASASLTGQYGSAGVERQRLGASVRYYLPQSSRAVLFLALSGDTVKNPNPADQLLLGGDNGLRGYPLRYQSGDRRVLLTVEERVYGDWYLFRLFRVGGAAFLDYGRAWSGPNENTVNRGRLGDVGVGLRILNTRAAFNNVLHVDLAFPTHRDPDIRSVQVLVKVRSTF